MKVHFQPPQPPTRCCSLLDFEQSSWRQKAGFSVPPFRVPLLSTSSSCLSKGSITAVSVLSHGFGSGEKHTSGRTLVEAAPPASIESVAAAGGSTRWNPTREQVAILEDMYSRGVRTPSAAQIEEIMVKLGKYGRIEGKNVFYWFQNHKARERQKLKRAAMLRLGNASDNDAAVTNESDYGSRGTGHDPSRSPDASRCKRRCRSWVGAAFQESTDSAASAGCAVAEDKTLELFPLRPERG